MSRIAESSIPLLAQLALEVDQGRPVCAGLRGQVGDDSSGVFSLHLRRGPRRHAGPELLDDQRIQEGDQTGPLEVQHLGGDRQAAVGAAHRGERRLDLAADPGALPLGLVGHRGVPARVDRREPRRRPILEERLPADVSAARPRVRVEDGHILGDETVRRRLACPAVVAVGPVRPHEQPDQRRRIVEHQRGAGQHLEPDRWHRRQAIGERETLASGADVSAAAEEAAQPGPKRLPEERQGLDLARRRPAAAQPRASAGAAA